MVYGEEVKGFSAQRAQRITGENRRLISVDLFDAPLEERNTHLRIAKRRFPGELLTVLKDSKGIRVRAGTGRHRFIGIWFVMVANRVLARSWSIKPGGWYRAFLKQPRGAIQVGKVEIAVRAVHVRSKPLKGAVDRAYLKKYNSGWEIKYAKDLITEKSRATTIEFVPIGKR